MTIVLPIKGLRFSDAAGSPAEVIAPPYDVIDSELQQRLFEKSPYNIIRLEYTPSRPGDNHLVNKYTRAAETFRNWLQEGILIREEKPAFYLYEQYFTYNQKKYKRQGFYCGVELSPFEKGRIIPHEETLQQPKKDRRQLLEHCQAQFSPIFGLYKDPEKYVDHQVAHYKKEQKPILNFQDHEGQLHILWAVTDTKLISVIQTFFQNQNIFIADGHHRYETALQYYLDHKDEKHSKEKYGYALMALVNIYDAGLQAFPTHRVIKQSDLHSRDLVEKLQKHFQWEALPAAETQAELLTLLNKKLYNAADAKLRFGLYTPGKKLFLLTLKDLREEEKPFPWLDTVILQELILNNIFGMDEEEIKRGSLLGYIRDEWAAKQKVDQGAAAYVFFLNSSSLEKIIKYAEQGLRMPQKSTYFYPKLVSGLLVLQLGNF
ncbi:MAG: DUF1015 domain-containing protein [Firmicutes bacterium]|nr:DUF1015 domain-containing protein [Bacillota bacterium]